MVTQTWTTSKDLTKNLHRNDPMPGKESGHRNGQDSCQPQSTRTRQGASPGSKAACRAWKLQPGGGIRREMKSCKSPVTERRIPELLKLAGGGCKLISLHYLLGKHCPVESVGGSSCPMAGGMEASWHGAGCRELILVSGIWPFEARRVGRKDEDQAAERWHMQVSSSWDTKGKSALGNATVRRAI